jgi:stage III sporulation protein SpoIIIAA
VIPEKIDDLDILFGLLPDDIAAACAGLNGERKGLAEIVLDLGRPPIARLEAGDRELLPREVGRADIDAVVARIGLFNTDNRAGLSGTLHRISAMRNRAGAIVGLTCRAGRAVPGAAEIIAAEIRSGKSVLVLGRPGVGKTTVLRDAARLAAEEKRVIVVDTSNEIAGDGDIPHAGIGRARRMQVPDPSRQHGVMIEAVENHMPQVVIVDEIGTEAEAAAARTISERGVQLIGTAHGVDLVSLMNNPTLADLLGGIHPVTLGDDEARRRGTTKSVLEREHPPTFDVVVELLGHSRVAVHSDVMTDVDSLLAGIDAASQERNFADGEHITRVRADCCEASRFGSRHARDDGGDGYPGDWPVSARHCRDRGDGGQPADGRRRPVQDAGRSRARPSAPAGRRSR